MLEIFIYLGEIFNGSKIGDKQSAKGLKMLTPNKMLSRLPVSLAHLKV